MQVLAPDGYILVVEDYRLPYGEKPNASGFFLLHTPQLRRLCKATGDEARFLVADAKQEGRLVAHLIGREVFSRVTHDSCVDALRSLRDRSAERIEEIRRSAAASFKEGLQLGLWLNLYANAALALQKMGE